MLVASTGDALTGGFEYGAALEITVAPPGSSKAVGISAVFQAGQDSNFIRGCGSDSGRASRGYLRRPGRDGFPGEQPADSQGEAKHCDPQSITGSWLRRANRCTAPRRAGIVRTRRRQGGLHTKAELRRAPAHELRRILPRRNIDPHVVLGALRLIVFAQTLAQTMSLHANDGVAFLIELRGPA